MRLVSSQSPACGARRRPSCGRPRGDVPQWPTQAALLFEVLRLFGWAGQRAGVGTRGTVEQSSSALAAKAGQQRVGGAHTDACTKARVFANRH